MPAGYLSFIKHTHTHTGPRDVLFIIIANAFSQAGKIYTHAYTLTPTHTYTHVHTHIHTSQFIHVYIYINIYIYKLMQSSYQDILRVTVYKLPVCQLVIYVTTYKLPVYYLGT